MGGRVRSSGLKTVEKGNAESPDTIVKVRTDQKFSMATKTDVKIIVTEHGIMKSVCDYDDFEMAWSN